MPAAQSSVELGRVGARVSGSPLSEADRQGYVIEKKFGRIRPNRAAEKSPLFPGLLRRFATIRVLSKAELLRNWRGLRDRYAAFVCQRSGRKMKRDRHSGRPQKRREGDSNPRVPISQDTAFPVPRWWPIKDSGRRFVSTLPRICRTAMRAGGEKGPSAASLRSAEIKKGGERPRISGERPRTNAAPISLIKKLMKIALQPPQGFASAPLL